MEKIWAVIYIDSTLLSSYERDLSLSKFGDIVEYYIPMVNILKKRANKKPIYEGVPMLFNYGFIRVPENFLTNEEILKALKRTNPFIFAYLRREPTEYNPYIIETVANSVIMGLRVKTRDESVWPLDSDNNISVGDYITLRNSPYDGVGAIITKITPGYIEVEITLDGSESSGLTIKSKLTKSEIYYTAYNHPHPSPHRELYLEDITNFNNHGN